MADKQPPQRESSSTEEERLMITYEPEPAPHMSTQTSPQLLRSPMPESEQPPPVPRPMAESPLHSGAEPGRQPALRPSHEKHREGPGTPPHTALPPVTVSERGSPGSAKTHFEPPPVAAARSWPSQPPSFVTTPPKAVTTPPKRAGTPPSFVTTPPKAVTTPPKAAGTPPSFVTTPPKAVTTPPKAAGTPPKAVRTPPKAVATPPKGEPRASAEPASGVPFKSDSEPITMAASGPGLALQTARKSATVGDVTNVAERHDPERKWELHPFFDSAPAKEPELEASRRERLVKSAQTFSVHLSFFGMGIYYALFGPTLQDLAVTLDVDLYHALFLLSARGIGYFLGAVAGGVLLRPVNPQVLLIVLDFFLAMACLGVSYFDTLFQSQLVFGLGGFALGAINIVGVLWVSALHRDASGFLVQTLSFMHCIGCTLAPILGEPFMTSRSVLQPPSGLPAPAERELAYLTSLEDKDFIYVAYAYWALGIYVFVVVFLALVAFFVDPRHQDLRPMETQCPVVPCSVLVVVLFFYLFTSVAMEIIYSQLIAAFALLLGHNKTVAAYVTSLFWAAYSTVRGMSIMWLKQHGSFNVLMCCNACLVAVAAFGSVMGSQARVMWIGTALAGACMAPVMPSTLLLLHDYSGVSVGRFTLAVFAVAVSSAFAPLCVGAELEREPMLFHYTLAALAVLSLLLVLTGRMLVRRTAIVFTGRTLVRRTAIDDGYALLPAERRMSYRSSK